jgi:prophage antirepressor-like protein
MKTEIKTMELQTFDFKEMPVRAVDRAGQPWFVAADVCRVLEISNHRDAVADLDEDERDGVAITDAIGRDQKTICISESGLFALIFKSRKPEARSFRKWVTGEVLPALRRTGGYGVLTGIGRVQRVVEMAICDLYEGRMSVDKAAAMAGLVGQYYRNGWRLGKANDESQDLEALGLEQREFSALVAAMCRHEEGREWTSLELRQLAVNEGLFSPWLNEKTAEKPSAQSRFGLLCDRQCSRDFDGVVFRRRGNGRGRVFFISTISKNGN